MADPQLDDIFARRMRHVEWRLDVIDRRHERRRQEQLSKALQLVDADLKIAGYCGAMGHRRADIDGQERRFK